MERPTKKVKLSSGKTLEIYTYITGAENDALERIFLDAQNVRLTSAQEREVTFSASVVKDAQNKALEMLIVSFDDSNENIIDRIGALPSNQAREIYDIVDSIGSDDISEDHEKKGESGNNSQDS